MFALLTMLGSFTRPLILIGGVMAVVTAVAWVESGAVARYEGERVAAALDAQRESAAALAERDASSRGAAKRWREEATKAGTLAAKSRAELAIALDRYAALEASGEATAGDCGPEDYVELVE